MKNFIKNLSKKQIPEIQSEWEDEEEVQWWHDHTYNLEIEHNEKPNEKAFQKWRTAYARYLLVAKSKGYEIY